MRSAARVARSRYALERYCYRSMDDLADNFEGICGMNNVRNRLRPFATGCFMEDSLAI